MLEEVYRCVAQRGSFTGPRSFTRAGPPSHGEITVREERVTHGGLYAAAGRLELKPGETAAVWALDADEDRSMEEVERDLPLMPSLLVIRAADGKLLELDPGYLLLEGHREEDDQDPLGEVW